MKPTHIVVCRRGKLRAPEAMNNYFSRLMRAARFPTKYSEKIAFVGDLVRAGLFFEDRDRYLALLDFPDVDEWFAS